MSSVAWLVPSLIEGSGGHRTILQNALYLEKSGNPTTIYLEDARSLQRGETGADAIERLFSYRFQDVRIGWGSIDLADAVFATIWYSAKVVRDLPFECKRLYFVQDWEACFNPMGDTYIFAENSYRYGLIPITIGRWLPVELREKFGVPALYFDFCADSSVYYQIPGVVKERAIAFIYQPEKPRRGSVLGLEALGIVKYHMPDVKIYLYGSKDTGNVWFEHKHLGLLSLDECNALYNRVQVGLCISSSNPSRIPFEMMAAGLPVVELHRNNTLYDLPEKAALLCDQTPESIAEGLIQLLGNPGRADQMSKSAVAFMANRGLEVGYSQFKSAFERAMQSGTSGLSVSQNEQIYSLPPVVASPFVSALPAAVKQQLKSARVPGPSATARVKKWAKRKLVKAFS